MVYARIANSFIFDDNNILHSIDGTMLLDRKMHSQREIANESVSSLSDTY